MIEATCTACGNINHVPEADIPVGAKFINCSSCKSRVAIPSQTMQVPAARPRPGRPSGEPFDLADLPVPKRQSALANEQQGKPAPKSALSQAIDVTDLPAPRSAKGAVASSPSGPTGLTVGADGTFELDDFLAPSPGLETDLPAPKGAVRPKPITNAPPPPTPPGIVDLPTPRGPRPDPMASRQPPADLPAPKARPPARPGAKAPTDMPLDLLMPVESGPRQPGPIVDLPTPKGIVDLPTPRGAAPGPIVDLPTPKGGGGGLVDLPQPRGVQNLPTPKAGTGADLPAPKGFFDDLPQPSHNPNIRNPDLPAPKGFFEDLPGKANQHKRPDLPAPKGYFEDLPGRPNASRPEVPAPKGYFEDLPGRPNASRPELPAPQGFFDDLPRPADHQMDVPMPSTTPLELDSSHLESLELEGTPSLDLGMPTPSAPSHPMQQGAYDNLDLSSPSQNPIRISTPSTPPAHKTRMDRSSLPPYQPAKAEPSFELEKSETRGKVKQQSQRLEFKRKPGADPDAAKRRAKILRIALVAILLLAGLGAGGMYFLKKRAEAAEREETISTQLDVARKAMAATDPDHWNRAVAAAQKVIKVDPKNAEALGIGAEASFVIALADGISFAGNIALGNQLLSKAREGAVTGSEIDRAQAVQALTVHQADRALPKIQALLNQQPKSGILLLYLGWAQAQRGDFAEAIKAFDLAGAAEPTLKATALYGRANAKLAQGNLEGARADYSAILQAKDDHLGAMVGLAAARPAVEAQRQEADLLAILARKDLDKGDQRAVVLAWTLAAESAKRSGRLDVARERYNKALAIDQVAVPALTGLAEVEARDGKLDKATDLITKATTEDKDNIPAQLVAADIEIRQARLDIAQQRIDLLAARNPPPPAIDQAHLKLVTARLLEKKGDDNAAVEAYLEAAKLAGDLDLVPALAAAAKLTAMAKTASEQKDKAKATEYREKADELLGTLAANAEKDPQLALTLGMAYLEANDALKAESWLERVIVAKPNDANAHYQLAKSLARIERTDEAIEQLQKALELDGKRGEVALELARTYELAGKDEQAELAYGKLLALKDPSNEMRARAGRFYARIGKIDKASEQGDIILKTEKAQPSGLYLKGEGLLAAGRTDDARKLFNTAVDSDREDPQFLDAAGRACEKYAAETKDGKYEDAAIHSYRDAREHAPKMFNPVAGLGRLYLQRSEVEKAVPFLLEAYDIERNGDVAFNLGVAYTKLQKNDVAVKWLEQGDKLKPRAEAGKILGNLYFRMNKAPLAQAALLRATKLAADDEKRNGVTVDWLTDALYLLGRVSMDMHQDAPAKAAWEKYVSRPDVKTTNNSQYKEVIRILGTELKQR